MIMLLLSPSITLYKVGLVMPNISHISKANLDTTLEGVVVSVLGNNKYTVRMNWIDYTIPGTGIPASNYLVGMCVLIEALNQNFSEK